MNGQLIKESERQQAVLASIVDVCAIVITTAEPSEKQFLLEVLAGENRSIFVSLVMRLAIGNRKIETQLDVSLRELCEAIDDKRHWVKENDFVQMVLAAVEMKMANHTAGIKNYLGALKELKQGKEIKSLKSQIRK
jgi:hypothetical protein